MSASSSVIVVQVLSGLAVWKPIQLSELASLFYDFQGARLVHFIGMALIVGFLVIHVALALLVPKTIGAMITGGPRVDDGASRAERRCARSALKESAMQNPLAVDLPSRGRHRQSVLESNKALVAEIDRRKILRGAISLGALTMLTGCNVTNTDPVQSVLKAVSQFNDQVQQVMFRPNHLAPTYQESQVVKPPRFNAYYDIEDVAPVDGATWKLELCRPDRGQAPWTAQQIYALPEQEWIIRHICVEGWDYIGQWSGVNLRHFLERIGADLTREIRRVQMRRRLLRLDRHGDARCIRRPSWRRNTPGSRSPIRSAFRCGCAPRPSSASRTRNGSPRSKSPTPIRAAIGKTAASTGSAGSRA